MRPSTLADECRLCLRQMQDLFAGETLRAIAERLLSALRGWASWRRGIALLALVGYIVAATGFSVSLVGIGGLFPCQFHQCGCRSAAQCWSHCCCFTVDQQLAWARANGITPPDSLSVPAAPLSPAITAATPWSCCSAKAAVRRCCTTGGNDKTAASVACTDSLAATSEVPKAADSASRFSERRTLRLHVPSCRGLGSTWTQLSEPVFPPPLLVTWSPVARPEGRISLLNDAPVAIFNPLLTPPG